MSFGSDVTDNLTPSFPLDDSMKIVAPFWNDISSINHQVKYLFATNISDDQGYLINDVDTFLIKHQNFSSYNAEWILVVQWLNDCESCEQEDMQVRMTNIRAGLF